MDGTCIARQPIVDPERAVLGYELLFRLMAGDRRCAETDGDRTSARLILNALLEIGLARAASGRLAFINCTEGLLAIDGLEQILPPKAVVLEVLESVEPTPAVMDHLRELTAAGFQIALDDFVYSSKFDRFLDLARYVKIDVQALSQDETRRHALRLRDLPVALIAEKVETYDEFRRCQDLGFHYFQGWFFRKPETLEAQTPPANRLAAVQVVAKLNDEQSAIEEIVRLVSLDPALSFCILRIANGALYARPIPIDSVHEGVMRIGVTALRRWIAVIMMSGLDHKPRELLVTAIVRGRMCETLGRARGAAPDTMFTLGLFSVLDALFDCPLDRVLGQIKLAKPLTDALLRRSGTGGQILSEVIAFETGEAAGDDLERLESFTRAWIEALVWAESMLAEIQVVRQAPARASAPAR
jgi:c-di-GMP phosphodiesterase